MTGRNRGQGSKFARPEKPGKGLVGSRFQARKRGRNRCQFLNPRFAGRTVETILLPSPFRPGPDGEAVGSLGSTRTSFSTARRRARCFEFLCAIEAEEELFDDPA